MSSKNQRITNGINSLVGKLLTEIPPKDDISEKERLFNAKNYVSEFLEKWKTPTVVAEINQASDLIKKRLLQVNLSPDQALRYMKLYNTLLSIPIIKEKWAVLHFLYQLSSTPENSGSPHTLTSPFKSPVKGSHNRFIYENDINNLEYDAVKVDRNLSEAFQREGLRRLPASEGGQRNRKEEDQAFLKSAAAQRHSVSLKTTLLAENYVEINPPETVLLRDMSFTLQGLSSVNLQFLESTLKLPTTLPVPIISILNTLAEPSLLYKELVSFTHSPGGGLLGQSLRAAVGAELRSYLGLVAVLEGQIRSALHCIDEKEPRGGIGKAGVTLKRLVVWTREATMGLRFLSLICEESKSKRGGQLISLIHGFSSAHGDPMVGSFAERLLIQVSRPFYDMLRHWIYDGELSDPHHESFVCEQDPHSAENQSGRNRGGASSVWGDKYKLSDDMVPSIITPDFAQKVFLIGKSLNFIRFGCGDAQWVERYSKAASKELKYGDTATLETWIDEAYKITMARLIQLMAEKFHLFEHLKALKNYILLGQGDFIALLMESLSSNLDRPAGAQYRHTLTAQLEHAIRGSNAQYDSPEVLRRLDARMLQLSHGDIGWDCFTLEYKVDAPVDVVVTEWGNRQYLKVFNFLWRIKRVEFALSSTWRKCMTGSRGVLHGEEKSVAQTWKLTRGVLAEMIHFIGQLQYYILFEVIESSWDELQASISKDGCTLDDLIKAHTKYLNDITHKGLLGAKNKLHGDADDNTFMIQLGEILRLMLSYRDAVDGLYSWSVSDFIKRQSASVQREFRGRREEDDGLTSPSVISHHFPRQYSEVTPLTPIDNKISDELPVLQERLAKIGSHFKLRVCLLVGELAYQPDVDMRFLGVAMNFNDFYQPVRKKGVRAVPRENVGRSISKK
ncbi:Spindle pole body component alp6 [Golovinomyces cichoracearum]|uniref:Spindle pole body component alp6 n=1 Tax=Golovinomyces cichoracearum TaxID=62708 RepID=A0A420IM55_9PEZI|nr:Spindle pole body component alp6 [Golovinomyces cichoracearum]